MLNEDDVQANVEESTRSDIPAEPDRENNGAGQVKTSKQAISGSPTKRKRSASDAVVDQVTTEMGKSRAGCLTS